MLINSTPDLMRFWTVLKRLLKYIKIWKKKLTLAFFFLLTVSIT